MNKKVSILTPTYNRAHTLPRLYKSLINQSNKDFCWILVDDGSTDNTHKLVEKWQQENIIDIIYLKQENEGKMQAHNTGVSACETEFFICVDSDDYITLNAIEKLNLIATELSADNSLVGCICYKGKTEFETLTVNKFPNIDKIKIGELYDNGFSGDTSIILKTNIVKKYLFPKLEGEKFIPEEYLYLQLDKKYSFKLLPEIIIVCEYQDDGYTKNALPLVIKNIKGVCLSIDYKIGATKKIKIKCENIIRYIGFSKLAGYKDAYKKSNHKFLYITFYLFGLIYQHRKKKVLNGKTN